MADRETLLALKERVEKASGPDYTLGEEIFAAVGVQFSQHKMYWNWPGERDQHFGTVPQITASIDAALALCERMLPGTMRAVGTMEEGPFCRLIVPDGRGGYIGGERVGYGATEPLAILSALLSALSEQPVQDGDATDA